MKVGFLGSLLQAACAAPRTYTSHAGQQCFDGTGGTPLHSGDASVPSQTEEQCQSMCDGNVSCVAFMLDAPGECRLRAAYDLSACTQNASVDMYTLDVSGLESFLQQGADTVASLFQDQYPNLALSMAWRDGESEVAVTRGSIAGRGVRTEDTFLYGSGTKPMVAISVMRLISSGRVRADDKVHTYVDPYLVSQGRPTMSEYFGENVTKATVLQLIRMSAGLRDFEDDYSYDAWVLGNGSRFQQVYNAIDFSVSDINVEAGGGDSKLLCNPGECSAYSSTSYVVAGLLLAAVLNPSGAWYDFDLGSAAFEDRHRFPGMHFPPLGRGDGNLSRVLTVPGYAVGTDWPKTTIYDQDPSILGWTCGNMVSSPRDVANYMFAAFSMAKTLLTTEAQTEMFRTLPTTKGWAAGSLHYGAGIMDLKYGMGPSSDSTRLLVKGHEGDTYGFISSSGYVPSMDATYSVASNVDNNVPLETMACLFLQSVQQFKEGFNHTLKCEIYSTRRRRRTGLSATLREAPAMMV